MSNACLVLGVKFKSVNDVYRTIYEKTCDCRIDRSTEHMPICPVCDKLLTEKKVCVLDGDLQEAVFAQDAVDNRIFVASLDALDRHNGPVIIGRKLASSKDGDATKIEIPDIKSAVVSIIFRLPYDLVDKGAVALYLINPEFHDQRYLNTEERLIDD